MFSTYDIQSSANACKTLAGLSGVDISTWGKFVGHESEYRYTDDLVEDVIKRFGHLPRTYLDFNFVYFHVTTSANECEAILDKLNTGLKMSNDDFESRWSAD